MLVKYEISDILCQVNIANAEAKGLLRCSLQSIELIHFVHQRHNSGRLYPAEKYQGRYFPYKKHFSRG